MKVATWWPALIPAIERAGHEAVLMPVECCTCLTYETCEIRPQTEPATAICLLWKERPSGK